MSLHCPRCGDALVTTPDGLYCVRGDMHFSQILDAAYRKHFEQKSEPAPDVRWKCKIGGEWFCPVCAQKMEEVEGRMWCSACSVNLGAFVYHIVEHHPHSTHELRKA